MAYIDYPTKLNDVFNDVITDPKLQLIFIRRQINLISNEFIEEQNANNKQLWLKDVSFLNKKYLDTLLRIACKELYSDVRWSKSAILIKGTSILKSVMHIKDNFMAVSNAIRIVESLKNDTY